MNFFGFAAALSVVGMVDCAMLANFPAKHATRNSMQRVPVKKRGSVF
jgi:hypothetical protein